MRSRTLLISCAINMRAGKFYCCSMTDFFSSRAVSIVPSAYYAHLVAARARCHIGDDSSDTASQVSTRSIETLSQAKILDEVANSMFFC